MTGDDGEMDDCLSLSSSSNACWSTFLLPAKQLLLTQGVGALDREGTTWVGIMMYLGI